MKLKQLIDSLQRFKYTLFMKLHLSSDLHNEFHKGSPPDLEAVDADVIILAGDIDLGSKGVQWAGDQLEKLKVKACLMINGNHEYFSRVDYDNLLRESYTYSQHRTLQSWGQDEPPYTLCFLENDGLVFDGVRFLACTLWTDFCGLGSDRQKQAMSTATDFMYDYERIMYLGRLIDPYRELRWNQDSIAWLKSQLAKPFNGPTVVVTHHGPSPQCHSVQKHGRANLESVSFWSNFEDLIKEYQPELWLYGHTHSNLCFEIGKTRVVTNQRGYPDEGVAGYNPKLIIEV